LAVTKLNQTEPVIW